MMRKRSNLRRYISKVVADTTYGKKMKTPYVDNYQYCQYNEEISKKFYKFLDLGLSLQFEVYEENENIILTLVLPDKNYPSASISGNISMSSSSSIYPAKAYSDESVTFYINKSCFKINRNHMEVCGYKDPFIYDLYKDKIKECYERRCAEVFHKTINEVLDMIPSIGREYKIDEIFND